jgi:hypothetical protein
MYGGFSYLWLLVEECIPLSPLLAPIVLILDAVCRLEQEISVPHA